MLQRAKEVQQQLQADYEYNHCITAEIISRHQCGRLLQQLEEAEKAEQAKKSEKSVAFHCLTVALRTFPHWSHQAGQGARRCGVDEAGGAAANSPGTATAGAARFRLQVHL